MDKIEQELLQKAISIHKKIYPCARKGNFSECFTYNDNRILFWFNTEDENTHVIFADKDSHDFFNKNHFDNG